MPKTFVTQTNRGAVEHTDEGQGDKVLLALHGGMGGVDQSWLLGRALLGDAAGRRLLALSRPGYLGTPMETGRTPEDQADTYASLLDGLGIEKVYVAAVSAGGPSAIAFALRHQSRCRGLVLVSAPTGPMRSEPGMLTRLDKLERATRIPGLVGLMGWAAGRSPRRSGLRAVQDADMLDRTLADPEAGPLLRGLQNSVMHRMDKRIAGTRNDTEQLAAMPTLPLGRISMPVLAVHGTRDRTVSFSHAEALAAAGTNVQLMRIEGGEHVALFTHLHEVRAAAREFLARN